MINNEEERKRWGTRGRINSNLKRRAIEERNSGMAGISIASEMNQRQDFGSGGLFGNFIWLSTSEAAEYLRTSPKQLRKWVYQGKVKAHKLLSKSLRFKKSDLDRLLEGGRVWG